ncbi:hypothetical protein GCM10027299_12900 [Larkinella ripae]
MKLTTGINQALHVKIATVEQKPDQGVIVIEFGVRRHYNAWTCLFPSRLCLGRTDPEAHRDESDGAKAKKARFTEGIKTHRILGLRTNFGAFKLRIQSVGGLVRYE